jgi:hypothetical protein
MTVEATRRRRADVDARGSYPQEAPPPAGKAAGLTNAREVRSAAAGLRVAIRHAIIPPMRVASRSEIPHVGDRAPTRPARRPGDSTHRVLARFLRKYTLRASLGFSLNLVGARLLEQMVWKLIGRTRVVDPENETSSVRPILFLQDPLAGCLAEVRGLCQPESHGIGVPKATEQEPTILTGVSEGLQRQLQGHRSDRSNQGLSSRVGPKKGSAPSFQGFGSVF